jgi:hypothetical protein
LVFVICVISVRVKTPENAEREILSGPVSDSHEMGAGRERSRHAERLAARAQQMLLLAERSNINSDPQSNVIDIFNAAQMVRRRR